MIMIMDKDWYPSTFKPTLNLVSSRLQIYLGRLQAWSYMDIQLYQILATLMLAGWLYLLLVPTSFYPILFFVKNCILRTKNTMFWVRGAFQRHRKRLVPTKLPLTQSAANSWSNFKQGTKKPVGLGNTDFSCYQNSVIQGLASLVSLQNFLHHVISRPGSSSLVVSLVLQQVIKILNTPQDQRMIWLPRSLKSMSSNEQQDAQEYYAKLLDQLDMEEQARRSILNSPGHVQMLVSKPQAGETDDCGSRNPLEGLIAQRVSCLQCGHSDGISLNPFNCLTLPLPPYPSCHIGDCLDEFTKLEHIDGVECPKCSLISLEAKLRQVLLVQPTASLQHRLDAVQQALKEDDYSDETLKSKCDLPKKLWTLTTKTKQSVIGRPPKSLVLHINRSRFDEQTFALYKDYANVKLSLELDLGPWYIDHQDSRLPTADPRLSMLPHQLDFPTTTSPVSDWLYELRAVVVHHGRHENGHYVCLRRYPSPYELDAQQKQTYNHSFPGWWELSDDDVTPISYQYLTRQEQAFMLFYELVIETRGSEEFILSLARRTPLPCEAEELDSSSK